MKVAMKYDVVKDALENYRFFKRRKVFNAVVNAAVKMQKGAIVDKSLYQAVEDAVKGI